MTRPAASTWAPLAPRAFWLAGVVWTVLVAALALWVVRSHTIEARGHIDATAGLRVAALRDTLALTLRQLAALPTHLARQPALHELLATLDLPDLAGASPAQRAETHQQLLRLPQVQAMNGLLDRLVLDFDLPGALLLDRHGNLVATGRRQAATGPFELAHNLRDREYVAQAMAQGSAMQFVRGRVSGAAGLSFASRILDQGVPIGVAVLRQSPDVLNRLLGEDDGSLVLVSDEHGLVVLSNRKEPGLVRLPEGVPRSDAGWTRLYREVPPLLAWEARQDGRKGGRDRDGIDTVRVGGVEHAMRSLHLAEQPFKVWVLAPLPVDPKFLAGMSAGSLALWLAGCLLGWILWRRQRSLAASLDARRELLEMTQALPLTVFRFETRGEQDPGRFTHLGREAETLFGVGRERFDSEPGFAWHLGREGAVRPPVEPTEFSLRQGERSRWLLAHSTPQTHADGVTVYNGYWLDITARRETESRLAAVFEHAPNGYVFFDPRRGITHCNPATLALFGVADEAALLGRVLWFPGLSTDVQADGRPSRDHALELMRAHARSRERVQTTDWRFSRHDRSPFDAEVSVIALDRLGVPHYCAVIEDVTLRKQAQAALQRARDVAESASRTKTSFLANMSHELRTPMNAIIGMTHLALEDGLPPRQRDYVDKAHQSARNLLQILNDILDVSKIEAGQLELEQIDFELDSVIDAMADVLSQRADEKGLELLFSATPELPRRLVGDPTRLRQVLVNLGGNAIKFTDRGEVTVGMEVTSQDAEHIELHGWVRDTGIGIGADALGRLFQPFTQADSSTTRRFGGTGLGLAISRQLVEHMGGRLWVESVPDRGSTFHFTARFGRSPARALSRAWLAGELKGRRALVVDDNAAALDVMACMLESIGIEVDRESSGEAAVERASGGGGNYTWVLLDWKMPGMDGVECARRLLELRAGDKPSIVLVTAFGREEAARASADLPLAGVLQKPVTLSNLYDCLLLARSTPHTAAPGVRAMARRTVLADAVLRKRLDGARVLLVEDHPLNQELASELLRRAGVQVELAGDGQQALDRLAAEPAFDAVLMDCQMPVMDGYEATRRLRLDPRWRDLPVIAMTASAFADDRDRALASGMNAHITKPLDVEAMLRTLADWVGERRSAVPALANAEAGPASTVLDTADGLARCMGKPELYQRLLQGFCASETGVADRLSAALAQGRTADAARLAHDLKGLAGTVGAHRLKLSAQALEVGIGAQQDDATRAALAQVTTDLAAVLDQIDTRLEAPPPVPERRS